MAITMPPLVKVKMKYVAVFSKIRLNPNAMYMHAIPTRILIIIDRTTDIDTRMTKLHMAPKTLLATNLHLLDTSPVNLPVSKSNSKVVMKFSIKRYSPYIVILNTDPIGKSYNKPRAKLVEVCVPRKIFYVICNSNCLYKILLSNKFFLYV